MNDYILLMHDDAPADQDDLAKQWPVYFAKLRAANAFQGGSSIGDGICMSKSASAPDVTHHLVGYIRVQAESLIAVRDLVVGNPVFEAGGTVEIRELPRD
jgi:hypothetical protein